MQRTEEKHRSHLSMHKTVVCLVHSVAWLSLPSRPCWFPLSWSMALELLQRGSRSWCFSTTCYLHWHCMRLWDYFPSVFMDEVKKFYVSFEPWGCFLCSYGSAGTSCQHQRLISSNTVCCCLYPELSLALVGKITTVCGGNWPNTLVSQLGLWWLHRLPDDIKRQLEGLTPSSSSSLPSGKFTERWVWCITMDLVTLILLCFVLMETRTESQGKLIYEGCWIAEALVWGCYCHIGLQFRPLCSAHGSPLKWSFRCSQSSWFFSVQVITGWLRLEGSLTII